MFKSVINVSPMMARIFRSKSNYQLYNITPEQLDRVPYYQDKWLAIAQNPTDIDFRTVRRAIDNAYNSIDLLPPKIFKFSSPQSLCDKFNRNQDSTTGLEVLTTFLMKLSPWVLIIWAFFSVVFVPYSGFKATLDILIWTNLPSEFYPLALAINVIAYVIIVQYRDGTTIARSIRKLVSILLKILYFHLFFIAPLITCFQNYLNPLLIVYASGWFFIFFWTLIKHSWVTTQWKKHLESQIKSNLHPQVQKQIDQAFDTDWLASWHRAGNMIANANSSGKLHTVSGEQLSSSNYLNIWDWIAWCSQMDFCISELECTCDLKLWHSLQVLVQSCSTVLPRTKFCYVSDRPTKIHFDEQQRLHGVGQPAISFADDTHLYFNQGVHLPSDYGKLHPHQWLSEWVLAEKNVEIRRILIEGIGYGRVCQELNARTIDTWREYTLLWIELPTLIHANNRTEEPIFLLKMTCPSTKHIHALRVPPNIGSARTAAKWVNWDIDPEGFIIET
jgi:hypothetical protein